MFYWSTKSDDKDTDPIKNNTDASQPRSSWGFWGGERQELTLSSELIDSWYKMSDSDKTIEVELKMARPSK